MRCAGGFPVRACSVDGCYAKHFGMGFCNKHYRRWRAHGDPLVDARAQRTPIADRFWPKVEKSDGCWIWTGCRCNRGYGQIGTGGKTAHTTAHRVSYELNKGPIPDGMHVLHSCDNPPCVRPDHLFLGTHTDNMRDMWAKQRGRCDGAGKVGSKNPRSVLTEEVVAEIRRMATSGAKHKAIAEIFGVTRQAISYVVRRETWKHVGESE